MNLDVHFMSQSNDWETPQYIIDFLENWSYGIGKFTLDPCATPDNTKALKYYTPKDDGLKMTWRGHNVFLNPPYGRDIGNWIEKAFNETRGKTTKVIALIPARPDTSYWHNFILDQPSVAVFFIRGRIKFGNSGKPAPFPSCLVRFFNRSHYHRFFCEGITIPKETLARD